MARVQEFSELLNLGMSRAQATDHMAEKYGVSIRQARRYAKRIQQGERSPAVPRPASAAVGFCYLVVHDKTQLVKIGCSTRWHESRKYQLMIDKGTTVLRLHKSTRYRDMEKMITRQVSSHQLPCSEWFYCKPETAAQIFDAAVIATDALGREEQGCGTGA